MKMKIDELKTYMTLLGFSTETSTQFHDGKNIFVTRFYKGVELRGKVKHHPKRIIYCDTFRYSDWAKLDRTVDEFIKDLTE